MDALQVREIDRLVAHHVGLKQAWCFFQVLEKVFWFLHFFPTYKVIKTKKQDNAQVFCCLLSLKWRQR